jgi:hypothetical protein
VLIPIRLDVSLEHSPNRMSIIIQAKASHREEREREENAAAMAPCPTGVRCTRYGHTQSLVREKFITGGVLRWASMRRAMAEIVAATDSSSVWVSPTVISLSSFFYESP